MEDNYTYMYFFYLLGDWNETKISKTFLCPKSNNYSPSRFFSDISQNMSSYLIKEKGVFVKWRITVYFKNEGNY